MISGWWALRIEKLPRWLGALLLGAALLRLAAGVLWFSALPHWGHGTPAEQAGYIMGDASSRDQAAWKLAGSKNSLWVAFDGQRKVDQYGGLLFLSAAVYRYLGSDAHQPLVMVVFTSAVSALAVLFTWALSRRAWDAQTAQLAAWIIALYPEAVLLGSSQMREAFTMTLVVIAFYGLLRYHQERTWKGIVWMVAPLVLYLPFSPPFAAMLLAMLGLTLLIMTFMEQRYRVHRRWLWVILGGLTIVILVGLWLALRQFTPQDMYNPFAMISWWLRKSSYLQAHYSKHASGLIQYIFDRTPELIHLPLLMVYGIVQPFLPAAIVRGSHAPIWPWITLWRSIGWTIMLVFLVYAPILALRRKNTNVFSISLTLIVWIGIVIASYRGGADLWDNPRYRATFAGLQAALVAWTWIEHRRLKDPWLRRIMLGVIGFILWLLPWYMQRYTIFTWPIENILVTLGLGILTACLLIFFDWARTKK